MSPRLERLSLLRSELLVSCVLGNLSNNLRFHNALFRETQFSRNHLGLSHQDIARPTILLSQLKYLKLDTANAFQCDCCAPLQYPSLEVPLETLLSALEDSRITRQEFITWLNLISDGCTTADQDTNGPVLETLVIADCPVTRYARIKSSVRTLRFMKKPMRDDYDAGGTSGVGGCEWKVIYRQDGLEGELQNAPSVDIAAVQIDVPGLVGDVSEEDSDDDESGDSTDEDSDA